MAKEWGVGIDHNGYANQYQINCDGLSILDLHASEYTLLHWLTILLENREFDTSTPLAAESERISEFKNFIWITKAMTLSLAIVQMTVYFSFAADFINGAISYRQLSNAMRLGKLGKQFVLKSKTLL